MQVWYTHILRIHTASQNLQIYKRQKFNPIFELFGQFTGRCLVISQKGVNNFKIANKTCLFLFRGVVPYKLLVQAQIKYCSKFCQRLCYDHFNQWFTTFDTIEVSFRHGWEMLLQTVIYPCICTCINFAIGRCSKFYNMMNGWQLSW